MSFEAKDYPISDILNKVVFDIPRNQRRYVWKKSSWQDLFEDVLFSITEEKPHFIGSIVLKKGSKKDGLSYYTIIDGQQRLTTITLFQTVDKLGAGCYAQYHFSLNFDFILVLSSKYKKGFSRIFASFFRFMHAKVSPAFISIRAFPTYCVYRNPCCSFAVPNILSMVSFLN